MRASRRTATLLATVLVSGALATASTASAAPAAPVQDWLQQRLATAAPTEVLRVYVHADSASAARSAAERSGLRLVEVFDKVGVAVAQGTPTQVKRVVKQRAVTYLEGDRPVVPLLDTSNEATRGEEAVATVNGPDGSDLDGTGVSIAIID